MGLGRMVKNGEEWGGVERSREERGGMAKNCKVVSHFGETCQSHESSLISVLMSPNQFGPFLASN